MRLSLADQIAQLSETAPADFDPEDVHLGKYGADDSNNDDDDGGQVDANAGREHYLNVGPSAIRRLHDSVSDPKYGGVRTSRRQLLDEEDVSETSTEGEEDEDGGDEEGSVPGLSGPGGESSEEEDEDEEADEDEEDESEGETESEADVPAVPPAHIPQRAKPAPTAPPADDALTTTLRQKREEDVKKGKAVTRQLALWDSVLDARIRLQKAATGMNRLPSPEDMSQLRADPKYASALDKLVGEALDLSEELFSLREDLMKANEDVTPPARKRRRIEGSEDEQQNIQADVYDASAAASALDHAFHPYLVHTLQKWSAKIQAVAPSVLLPNNRNAFSNSKQRPQHLSAAQLVDAALAPGPAGSEGPREKALGKTRVYRGKGDRVRLVERENGTIEGEGEEEEEDPEVFDDTEFYQQLLRDVIDARSGANNSGLGDHNDWLRAQQRARKAKKKVDTKASKGRKLRFEVHEKLQNFMVPVDRGGWHEEQIDELFASLLGRGFETAATGAGLPRDAGDSEWPSKAPLGGAEDVVVTDGFRVFG